MECGGPWHVHIFQVLNRSISKGIKRILTPHDICLAGIVLLHNAASPDSVPLELTAMSTCLISLILMPWLPFPVLQYHFSYNHWASHLHSAFLPSQGRLANPEMQCVWCMRYRATWFKWRHLLYVIFILNLNSEQCFLSKHHTAHLIK